MGDFKYDKKLRKRLPNSILLGIENHKFVDKQTDQFDGVKSLRPLFSNERRRFAGVITDIAFDYYLIKHWSEFAEMEFRPFIEHCYAGLGDTRHLMPERMQYVVHNIIEHDWLSRYRTLDGIGATLDQVSKRIRFKNNLAGGIVEVEANYERIEAVFLPLFSHLKGAVNDAKIEV